jgi:hypothetical protein
MARHANEGRFYPWSSPALHFDDGHPIVQGAFGGHPSYPNTCMHHVRAVGARLLSDWIVCGSGRFAFRAPTTPLVDLASSQVTWACWPGHFGEAAGREVVDATADTVSKVLASNVFVAGPRSPLQQAENGVAGVAHFGVCGIGSAASEVAALRGVVGRLPGGARP